MSRDSKNRDYFFFGPFWSFSRGSKLFIILVLLGVGSLKFDNFLDEFFDTSFDEFLFDEFFPTKFLTNSDFYL